MEQPEFEMPRPEAVDSSATGARAPVDGGPDATLAAAPPTPGAARSAASTEVAPSGAAGTTPTSDSPARRRFEWRHLLIVGVVCALVGAMIPLAIGSVDRSAEAARVDGLRAHAAAYLEAIASADWATAATLSPPSSGTAELAPAEVLDGARRIQNPAVVLAHVDGDAGVVQVRYQLEGRSIDRLLTAAHVDGSWQLTDSLAELPSVANYDGVSVPSIAGVPLGRPPVLLLPGAYTLDSLADPIYEYGGDTIVIDGLQGSVTEIGSSIRYAQSLLDQASRRALTHSQACQGVGACTWPETAAIDLAGEPFGAVRPGAGRALMVQVPIAVTSGAFNEQLMVQVELAVAEDGTVLEAICSGIQGYSESPVPCNA